MQTLQTLQSQQKLICLTSMFNKFSWGVNGEDDRI